MFEFSFSTPALKFSPKIPRFQSGHNACIVGVLLGQSGKWQSFIMLLASELFKGVILILKLCTECVQLTIIAWASRKHFSINANSGLDIVRGQMLPKKG